MDEIQNGVAVFVLLGVFFFVWFLFGGSVIAGIGVLAIITGLFALYAFNEGLATAIGVICLVLIALLIFG